MKKKVTLLFSILFMFMISCGTKNVEGVYVQKSDFSLLFVSNSKFISFLSSLYKCRGRISQARNFGNASSQTLHENGGIKDVKDLDAWSFAHCYASCDIRKCAGTSVSNFLGILKEACDFAGENATKMFNHLKNLCKNHRALLRVTFGAQTSLVCAWTRKDLDLPCKDASFQDLKSNRRGLTCGTLNKDCAKCCLKNELPGYCLQTDHCSSSERCEQNKCTSNKCNSCTPGEKACVPGQAATRRCNHLGCWTLPLSCNKDEECKHGQCISKNNCVGVGTSCTMPELGVCRPGKLVCKNNQLECERINGPSNEICDGADNDCDGEVDENRVCCKVVFEGQTPSTPSAIKLAKGQKRDFSIRYINKSHRPLRNARLISVSHDKKNNVWIRSKSFLCDESWADKTCFEATNASNVANFNQIVEFKFLGKVADRAQVGTDPKIYFAPYTPECGILDGWGEAHFWIYITGCQDGESRSCGTETGECTKGTQTCSNGKFGSCSGKGPSKETCDKKDNDCDGKVDEGCGCSGPSSQSCGNCGTQTRSCNNGVWSSWGNCNQGQCTPNQLRACGSQGIQKCSSSCQWETCKLPDRPLYRFRSTNGDQAHRYQSVNTPISGFVIENGGRPVLRVFSYNPGYLTKLMQCSRNSSRDYILTLFGSPEYQAINGKGFTCYDNGWWVLNVAETRYPGYSSVPVCLRGNRPGDSDHIFTLNRQELKGLNEEKSGFRVWPP